VDSIGGGLSLCRATTSTINARNSMKSRFSGKKKAP